MQRVSVESSGSQARKFKPFWVSVASYRCCCCCCRSDLYSLSVSSPFAVRYPCVCDAATASACDAELNRRWRGGTASASRTAGSEAAAATAAAAADAFDDVDSNPAFDPLLLCVVFRAEELAASLPARRVLLLLRLAGLAARCEEDDDDALLSPFLTLRGRERERVRATIARQSRAEQQMPQWQRA